MKIIAVNNPTGIMAGEVPSVTLYADSALLTGNRPLFLPDYMDGTAVSCATALRISRLGKNISPRFASRYYDAVTVATLAETRLTGGLANAVEGAVAIGEWIAPVEDFAEIAASGADVDLTCRVDSLREIADAVVAALSRYMTMKMGDIVITGPLAAPLPLKIGGDISFTLNGVRALTLKPR